MTALAPRTIRSILVHLDGTPGSDARLATARKVALQTEATVWTMFVAGPPDHPLQMALSESPAALLETVDRAAARRARTLFDGASAEGSVAMQWLDSMGVDAVAAFRRCALLADLLMLGQRTPDAPAGTAAPPGFVESVLIETGQPALVMPCESAAGHLGRHVLVGWDATPPAAHAVAAALPWMQGARSVHVLRVGSIDDPAPDGLSLARYLRCHGVDAAMHFDARSGSDDAGDALLAMAREVSADLLVMGCYGHSRARELVLGGATRTVLQSMTLPVLMVH